jgi:hypothetical protein
MRFRRSLALVVGLAFAGAPGCGEKDPPPVTAAKAYASAMNRGDVKALLLLVDRAAVERIEQSAGQASDHVGGRRNIEPHEMLQIVDVPSSFQVAAAELVTGDAESAQVRLTAADGSVHLLDLVLQDGSWRVRVPLPPVGTMDGAT